jgi:hypothetical protein
MIPPPMMTTLALSGIAELDIRIYVPGWISGYLSTSWSLSQREKTIELLVTHARGQVRE